MCSCLRLDFIRCACFGTNAAAAHSSNFSQSILPPAKRRSSTIQTPRMRSKRIAISASRRRWRGEEPHWDLPEPPVPPGPLESDAVDQRDWLRRGLADLSILQRAVVVLRYAEDMSERQVAETLGISTGSVKTHAFRGLARLRATGHPDQTGAEEVRP